MLTETFSVIFKHYAQAELHFQNIWGRILESPFGTSTASISPLPSQLPRCEKSASTAVYSLLVTHSSGKKYLRLLSFYVVPPPRYFFASCRCRRQSGSIMTIAKTRMKMLFPVAHIRPLNWNFSLGRNGINNSLLTTLYCLPQMSFLLPFFSIWPPFCPFIHEFRFFEKIRFPAPGIEPGPAGWEPAILTTRPCRNCWETESFKYYFKFLDRWRVSPKHIFSSSF